jgi:signal transduction histidine kinase
MVLNVPNPVEMAEYANTSIETAHRGLLDKRARLAMLIGVPFYALDSLEPWFTFHQLKPVEIQLSTAFLLLCVTALSYTQWGARHKLALVTVGFLLGVAGYEAIVCYTRAFGTVYGDGFSTLFAFYCVLIPSTVWETALTGIATVGLTAIPEALMTGDVFTHLPDVTPFVILLCGRHIANKLWKSEFLARQQSESFYKQLVQSEKMAALGRLTAGLAHELNNPIAIIASNVVSIERYTARLLAGKTEDQPGDASSLLRAVERLRVGTIRLSSVNDLLRQYVSPPRQEMIPSDIDQQLDLASSLVESKAQTKQITIRRETTCETLLLCDPQSLSHVFVNLLDNACDAVALGGNIWVRSDRNRDGALQISVRDDGPGIDESLEARLGEPFVTTKEPGHGLGLGLALCKAIVEKHSGHLELVNRQPGTQAILTFPASSLRPKISSAETTLLVYTRDAKQPT